MEPFIEHLDKIFLKYQSVLFGPKIFYQYKYEMHINMSRTPNNMTIVK